MFRYSHFLYRNILKIWDWGLVKAPELSLKPKTKFPMCFSIAFILCSTPILTEATPPARHSVRGDSPHVIPGEQARAVPSREAPLASHPTPERKARQIPGREMARQEPAIIGGRTIPGTRPAGKRPIAVSRPLPARIVIDRRSRPCPYLCLTPYAIAKKGAVIELSDGSIWEVRHRNRRMVKKWKPEDVIIVETGSFLSWSNYRLVNCTRGETADVELAGADRLGSHSHWIVELNAGQGYLRLEDGALWRLSAGELARWRVNDDVIVGISKDPLADQYQQILINPRAKSRLVASFEF